MKLIPSFENVTNAAATWSLYPSRLNTIPLHFRTSVNTGGSTIATIAHIYNTKDVGHEILSNSSYRGRYTKLPVNSDAACRSPEHQIPGILPFLGSGIMSFGISGFSTYFSHVTPHSCTQ